MNNFEQSLNEATNNALKTYLKFLREKKITQEQFDRYINRSPRLKAQLESAQRLIIKPKLANKQPTQQPICRKQPLTLHQKIYNLLWTEIPLPTLKDLADFWKEPTNWKKHLR